MLHVHHAERADQLVAALGDVLAEPPDDALAREVVAVHSRGIERWLTQQLALRLGAGAGHRDGVCANIDFPFPRRLVGHALATAAGVDPDRDPWAPDRLVWPLLGLLDAHDDEVLDPVRAHVRAGAEAGSGRRLAVARRVADLFDRYAVHRPEMVRAWNAGDDHDGDGEPLAAAAAWQPHLWRLLADRLDVADPVTRNRGALELLRDDAVELDLPRRLALFGLTALPATYLDVLSALGRHREVRLLLLHPSPALWQRVTDLLRDRPVDRLPSRRDDPTDELAHNPLLAAWGRDARELQLVVASAGAELTTEAAAPPAPPAATGDGGPDQLSLLDPAAATGEPSAGAGSLLARLQADVRDDRAPAGARPPMAADGHGADRRDVLDAHDRSVTIHACHGRTRQVEVMRDAVLHLLADDPTLEPRDIVVLCPDIEVFAPLVEAVFGATPVLADDAEAAARGPLRPDAVAAPDAGEPDDHTPDGSPLPDLRVRLADRSIRQTNAVLKVVAELLDLVDGRLTAPAVLDLATREPVRRRFRLDEDDLATLEGWVTDLNIRWGLDGGHRVTHGLPDLDDHTWRAGLDRLLLGLAMADEDLRTVGGRPPYDAVAGRDADLAGRFAELVARLRAAVASLTRPQPIADWAGAIATAAELLTATRDDDRWQHAQVTRLLDDVVAASRDADGQPSQAPLSLAEVRELLAGRLRGRPSRANHRTGDLTVCTLVPMRAVPHRVVCLLGMDDETFPRRTVPDGDDLLELAPRVADRDPRTEDRQLLLDALLSAGDHLVVTYTGRDERTNEPKPPAVPIGELIDTIDATVRGRDGRPARDHVVLTHPLQPFDRKAFTPGALLADRPWGFEPADLAGARARAGGQVEPGPFLPVPLGPLDDPVIDLDDLAGCLTHPTRTFLRRRLDVSFPGQGDEPDERIPVELDPLARYDVGDRMLAALDAGIDRDRWLTVERTRGTLPPGALADPALDDITATVDELRTAAAEQGAPATPGDADTSIDVDVEVGHGRSLVGTVGGVAGDALLAVRYAKVSARHRLVAWTQLVAATAAHPERALSAVLVGRSPKKSASVRITRLGPLGDSADERRAAARTHLATLVDLYDRGMCAPIPLYCKTSAAWAEATLAPVPAKGYPTRPQTAASREWTTGWMWDNEDRDPAHALVLGPDLPFEALLAEAPRDDESGDGWDDAHDSRFARYALRLWQPLLANEAVEDR